MTLSQKGWILIGGLLFVDFLFYMWRHKKR